MALQPLTYRVDDHNFTGYLADGSAGHPQERAALLADMARPSPPVDPARIAAVGFCFGGTTVLGVGPSFTNREINAWHIPGCAYHTAADRRSWRAMSDLLREVFDTSMHTTVPAEGKCEN